MVDLEEAARMMSALPDVGVGSSYGNRTWTVGGKGFAWVRPFRKVDLRRFGDAPVPGGPILAVRVADLRAKAALLARGPAGVFTIPHFDGHPAVLVQLDAVGKRVLERLLVDAWLACVPPSSIACRRTRVRKPRV